MGKAKEKSTGKQQKQALKQIQNKMDADVCRGSHPRISPNSLIVKMIGAFVILIIMIFLVGTVS